MGRVLTMINIYLPSTVALVGFTVYATPWAWSAYLIIERAIQGSF